MNIDLERIASASTMDDARLYLATISTIKRSSVVHSLTQG